jgi:hypothetical protein
MITTLPLIDLDKVNGVIQLGKKKNISGLKDIGAGVLDLLGSAYLEPTTLIKNPAAALKKVRERRQTIANPRNDPKEEGFKVIGETITATAYGAAATLGIANPAAAGRAILGILPKSPRAVLGTLTGVGILTTSETARKLAANALQDPTRVGREAGLLIDQAVKNKGLNLPSVSDAVKTAGIIGAGVVGTAAAYNLGKKAYSYFFTNKSPSNTVIPVTPSGITSSVMGQTSPITSFNTSGEPAIRSVEQVAPQAQVQPINIKINNKPKINVAVAQSL